MKPTTLIIGASDNPQRYSFMAARSLSEKGYPIKMIGIDDFEIFNERSLKGHPVLENIDTITLYIRPSRQPDYYEYILALKPRRVIFNPGTENRELENLLELNKIEVEIVCTLVMLSIGDY